MDSKGCTYKELSRITGYSVGVLNKMFNNGNVKFDTILSVIRNLVPEKETEMIQLYCRQQEDIKPENLKDLLEYTTTHRLDSLLDRVIEMSIKHKNKIVNQWGSFYKTLKEWRNRKMTDYEAYEWLRESKVTCNHLKVLVRLMEMNYFYVIKDYKIINDIQAIVRNMLDGMEDSYLKNSFIARVSEMTSALELRVNKNVEEARKHALDVIERNIGETYSAFSYQTLALSYINDSKVKFNHYYLKALNILDNWYENTLINDMENRRIKINSIIDRDFDRDFVQAEDDPLDLLIKGIKSNDTIYIYACMTKFQNAGDAFLAEIPKMELIKRGCAEELLSII